MTRILCCLLFISLLLSSCKKQELIPPDESSVTNPSFLLTMNIDGQPTTINAGLSDYYMYSSYMQDSGVYTFKADLKQIHCSNCPNSLSISIRDAQQTALNQSTTIGNALYPGYFPFHKGSTAGCIAWNLPFFSQMSADTYQWNFGDGNMSTQANPTHVYSRAGTYTVSLNTTSSGCNSSLYNVYKIAVPGSGCQIANVYSTTDTGGLVTFNRFVTGTAPFTYSWDFGDGNTSTLSNPTHTYATPGIYHVTLSVSDAGGNSATCNYDYISPSFGGCATAFSQNLMSGVSNPDAFSNIVITWSDALGNVYTSDNAAQPASSYFQIVSVDDFDNNENGQTTKKLHVKFNCTVYNGVNSHTITNADATIAVAFK